jgi:hypothetical protein
MTGRFGFGAGGTGGGVIFLLVLPDGAAGVVFAAGALLVLLFAVGVEGAQVIDMHNTAVSTRIGNNLFFIPLSLNSN